MNIASFSWSMKWQHVLAFVTTLLMCTALIWFRRDPIETINPGEIAKEASVCSKVKITRSAKYLRSDCHRLIYVWIVDSKNTLWNRPAEMITSPINATKGPPLVLSRETDVPCSAAYGTARYLQRVDYMCFPFYELWPIVMDLPELKFAITPLGH